MVIFSSAAVWVKAQNPETQVTLTWNLNPEPDIAGYRIHYGETNTPATIVETTSNTYSLSSLIPGRSYYFFLTAYNTSGLESEQSQSVYYTAPSTPPPILGTSASFISTDNLTSGRWKGRYGGEGGISPWGYLPLPSYASVRGRGNNIWGWNPSIHLEPALEMPAGYDRIKLLWYNATSFEMDLLFADVLPHKTSFYFFDFGNSGRIQKLELFDQVSGKLLAETLISNFAMGVHSTWELSGQIRARVSLVSGPNCIMSGILFGDGAGGLVGTNLAEFDSSDTETGGMWMGAFGALGHTIATENPNLPPYASVVIPGAKSWIWNANTTDPAALQRPNQSGRIASTWYSPSQFTVNFSFADTNYHPVSLYFVDFEGFSREQTIEFIDPASGAILDQTLLSAFYNGVWLKYNLRGDVILRITKNSGANAVLSGIFFD